MPRKCTTFLVMQRDASISPRPMASSSVEAASSVMNVDKTRPEQEDQLQRCLHKKPLSFKSYRRIVTLSSPSQLGCLWVLGCAKGNYARSFNFHIIHVIPHAKKNQLISKIYPTLLVCYLQRTQRRSFPSEGRWYRRCMEAALKRPVGSAGHSVFALYVGLQFDSEVEAYEFYNTYSWEMGSGIKRGRKYGNTSGYKSLQEFSCSCEVHLFRSPITSFSCISINLTTALSLTIVHFQLANRVVAHLGIRP
jgi:hypothetical protein